jgi:glycosyltransferase involved in cell wall biosynthesis
VLDDLEESHVGLSLRTASLRESRAVPHIGLNLVFLVPGATGGMEVVARELIPALAAQAPADTRFTAFVSRDGGEGPWRELMPVVTVPVSGRNPLARVLGEQLLLPRMAAREGVDLVHSLGNTGPLRGRFRRVVSVYDLIYARVPESSTRLRERGVRLLVPAAVRRSDRVIAASASTRADLIELLHARPERIDVVHPGIGTVRRAEPTPAAEVRARFDLRDRRVLLSLSAKRPHKNLAALIDALAQIEPGRRPVLVLPGYPTWHEDELRERARAAGVADDVRLLGWLPEAEVEGLWAIADGFAFPSLYEGFGLPVLEAMARGVPVASSDAASLPEVAGDAALLFDPRRRDAIVAALLALLEDEPLRARLRAAGAQRAALFSWERAARLTLESYTRALASDC